MIKIGVFTVSTQTWEPFEAIEKIAAMGLDGVECRVSGVSSSGIQP